MSILICMIVETRQALSLQILISPIIYKVETHGGASLRFGI